MSSKGTHVETWSPEWSHWEVVGPLQGGAKWEVVRSFVALHLEEIKVAFVGLLSWFLQEDYCNSRILTNPQLIWFPV